MGHKLIKDLLGRARQAVKSVLAYDVKLPARVTNFLGATSPYVQCSEDGTETVLKDRKGLTEWRIDDVGIHEIYLASQRTTTIKWDALRSVKRKKIRGTDAKIVLRVRSPHASVFLQHLLARWRRCMRRLSR